MNPSFLNLSAELCQQSQDKPFYKIFIEITQDKMGHLIPDVVRVAGLTDKQVRAIITRRVKDKNTARSALDLEPIAADAGKEKY